MPDWLPRPWPWYVGGPLIGLMVPGLLLLGNKSFGFSSNLRHICAAWFPGKVSFFHYDWKKAGTWNLAFLAGTLLGGFIGARLLATGSVALSAQTQAALTALGLHDLSGLVPREAFSWAALATPRGIVMVVVGGFLVGFQSFQMYGVIGSAMAVAATSVALIRRFKVRALTGEEIAVAPKAFGTGRRYWIGGTVFGLGWALTGACPGPLVALIGSGATVFVMAVLAAVAGTRLYGFLRPHLPH